MSDGSAPTGPTAQVGSADVVVLGRFPPPLDGQTVATRRLADLLASRMAVTRVSVSAPEDAVTADVRLRPERVVYYMRTRSRIRNALTAHPRAAVVWTSVSPALLGHLRDLFTVIPEVQDRTTFAVVHRGDFERLFRSPVTARTARRLAARVRAFVFLNGALSERCAPWLAAEQRVVIPNAVEDAVAASEAEIAAKRYNYKSERPFRILFLSNMIPSKGYEDVLRAVGVLKGRGVPVQATFAGRWPNAIAREAFEALVLALGLSTAVTHLGGVEDRWAIRQLYLDADAFALPTTYPTEAAPITICEALSAGTPVLVTQHAGIPAMVREDEARFVPPNDPAALADAIEALRPVATWHAASVAARTRFLSTYCSTVVRVQWERLLAGSS
jgi:glycosyltransferase involved in cell wall biosynthesis